MSHRLLFTFCHAIRWIVGGLFVYAGSLKLLDVPAFAAAVDGFRLLPWPLVAVTAVTLPVLEVVAGLLWMSNFAARPAGTVIAGLCALFCAVLASAWGRGLDVSCGCFGALGGDSVGAALLRAMTLLAAAIVWLRFARSAVADSPAPGKTHSSLLGGPVATRAGLLLLMAGMMLSSAKASVSISAQFGELYESDAATRAPLGSLALVVADTAGNGLPDPVGLELSAGQTFGTDNVVLAVAPVSAEESTAGAVRHVDFGVINFSYPGAAPGAPLAAGTKLWLVWFPSLSTPGAQVPSGISYGAYRSETAQPESESTIAFVAPADGSTHRLAAFTDTVYTALQKTVPTTGKVSPADFSASLVARSGFDLWLGGIFSEEELADPAQGGVAGDLDEDGIPNLAEYAFGLDPRSIDPEASVPNMSEMGDGERVIFRYRAAKNAPDVSISVERSVDLSSWETIVSGQAGVTRAVSPHDDNTDTVVWTVPVPSPGVKVFLRWKVSRQ